MKLVVKEISNGLDVSLAYTRQKTDTEMVDVSENVSEHVSENVSENLSLSQQKILTAIKAIRK